MNALWEFVQDYGWFIGIPILFLVVVAIIYRPGAKKEYQEDAEIPFEDSRQAPPEDREDQKPR
jgi:cbb3-type cytochrome oxidase subunit 3